LKIQDEENKMPNREETERDVKLLVSFVAMVFVGLGNKSKSASPSSVARSERIAS
jgi:hypothetical protein